MAIDRPDDVGDQFPSDTGDTTPTDPITNRGVANYATKPPDVGYTVARTNDPDIGVGTTAEAVAAKKRGIIKSINNDTLTVAELDDDGNEGDNVIVAKPELLRQSLTSRGNETYTYTDSQNRTADNGSVVTTQKIIPSYLEGDTIYFDESANGTGIDGVSFIDDNKSARTWCITGIE